MKDFDLEGLSREMPYKMPEHFLDDMTERVVSQIGKQRKQNRDRKIVALFASAASVAAVALLFIHPFGGGLDIPDYENISQCTSIDELFQNMTADELGVYSMMSNYYGN
ncbi:MAG: hypothetical protein J5763_04210 [Bacteroidaceae bacterium]|jgi:hypothetical protein|nr:hypothetical protein [Bacteroidaceae bacterium]